MAACGPGFGPGGFLGAFVEICVHRPHLRVACELHLRVLLILLAFGCWYSAQRPGICDKPRDRPGAGQRLEQPSMPIYHYISASQKGSSSPVDFVGFVLFPPRRIPGSAMLANAAAAS